MSVEDDSQVFPVFLQFMDCVSQVHRQIPGAFEFNDEFLCFIMEHLYSGQFGTFITNSESARQNLLIRLCTESLWTEVLMDTSRYLNPLYLEGAFQNIAPSCNVRSIHLWTNYYLRWYESGEQFSSWTSSQIVLPHPSATCVRTDILVSASLGHSPMQLSSGVSATRNFLATERHIQDLERAQQTLTQEINLQKQRIEQLKQKALIQHPSSADLINTHYAQMMRSNSSDNIPALTGSNPPLRPAAHSIASEPGPSSDQPLCPLPSHSSPSLHRRTPSDQDQGSSSSSDESTTSSSVIVPLSSSHPEEQQ